MFKFLPTIILALFFTAQNVTFAQSTNSNGIVETATHPNRQYFLITTQKGGLHGLTNNLKAAFHTDKFLIVDIDEPTSKIKITAVKGTTIEQVKAILVQYGCVITKYKEEYTGSNPIIFQNN